MQPSPASPEKPKADDNTTFTAAALFSRLYTEAFPYHQRARDCSAVTIPYLMPPQGTSGATMLPTPWQSTGAEGVNTLAAKLLLALLPPNTPFFRLHMADFVKHQAGQDPKIKANIEAALAGIERAVMQEIEQTAVRVTLFETLKHLINDGNGCVYLPPDGGMRFYRITEYVVQRDEMGDVVKGIIKSDILYSTLDLEVQALVRSKGLANYDGKNDNDKDDEVCVYTVITLVRGKMFRVHQELSDGTAIPGSYGMHPKDKSPYLFLRWQKMASENYGRGHVEEYLGDLQTLDGLSKSITEGAAIASKVVFLVDPNGTTQAEDINRAENGDAVNGRDGEVKVFQAEKFADFQVAKALIGDIEKRLARAFMLTSSVQRDAERVTAEEIRVMATELESSIGGVYSILSQEFQLPFLRRLMARMTAMGKLPVLPKGTVEPTIVTGLEALGRGAELNKLIQFTEIISQTLGPQAAMQVLKPSQFTTKVGALLGIDTTDVVNTPEEIAAAQQAQQRQETIKQLGPAAMQAASRSQQPQGQ